jgi:alpha-beta hydrolase superfamily lysophospholipase
MITPEPSVPKGHRSQRAAAFWPIAARSSTYALVGLSSLVFCAAGAKPKVVSFKSSDGIALSADYRAPAKGKPVFILLHGLGAGRGEWAGFAAQLAERGYGSLALDARGHGKSGGPAFETFRTTEAWEKIELDLEAALAWLRAGRVPASRVALGGASIGANLALRVAARHPEVPCAMILSPGLTYQGVTIEGALASFEKPILLAAAPDDAYAFRTSQWASLRMKSPRSRFLQAATGHGARMFEGEANRPFVQELLKTIDETLRPSPASSSGSRASP